MIVGIIIKYASSEPDSTPPHVKIVDSGNTTYSGSKAPESVLLNLKNDSIIVKYNIWGEVTQENKALSQLVNAVSVTRKLYVSFKLDLILNVVMTHVALSVTLQYVNDQGMLEIPDSPPPHFIIVF